jgi:hypothetical protein
MSLLENFPHTATAMLRVRTNDELGGSRDAFTEIFTERACWQQTARESEITKFEKLGKSATDKVYFLTDPLLTEEHVLIVSNPRTDQSYTFEVRSTAVPDASAGLGIVYRVMVEAESPDE